MTSDAFNAFRAVFDAQCTAELDRKGPDYCHTDDRLENFKLCAAEWGLDALQVWAIYFGKHLAAIRKYAKDRRVSSESIRSRFMDARNYLDLGLALIEEEARNYMEGLAVIEEEGAKASTVTASGARAS